MVISEIDGKNKKYFISILASSGNLIYKILLESRMLAVNMISERIYQIYLEKKSIIYDPEYNITFGVFLIIKDHSLFDKYFTNKDISERKYNFNEE